MGIYELKKQWKLPALILKRMDGWKYSLPAVPHSHHPVFVLLRKQGHNTSECSLAACQITHSIMAGSVDNVNLLEVPVQEVSTDGQDVAATAIILLHCHGLRQTGAWGWCTAAQRQERGKKYVIKVPKEKQDTHSERVNYLNGNSNLCTLDKRTNRMSFCVSGFPLRLADVKLDVQQKTNSQERPKQQLCECLSAYGQELARWHKPQTGFLIRYMGHPYAASAKSM